jgi:cobalt/nickel transport protein
MRTRAVLALGLYALLAPGAPAHFNMLLPDKASAKKGETVTFTCQWGHPFEHQLFDAPKPANLVVVHPDGKKVDLTDKLEKVSLASDKGKKVTGYRLRFTPGQRGDFVFLLKAPPIWLAEDNAYVEDTVKVVLHVQAQNGWDQAGGGDPELMPLTRPYGLRAGLVFQAQVVGTPRGPGPVRKPRGLEGLLVEVERYNSIPPKDVPPDEDVTRTVKTGPGGVATTTLTEPGWWCLTATLPAEKREFGKKIQDVRERSTLWVFVSDKPAKK